MIAGLQRLLPYSMVCAQVSFIQADDPYPDPPPSAEPCACGAAVTVTHVIYRLIHELPDN